MKTLWDIIQTFEKKFIFFNQITSKVNMYVAISFRCNFVLLKCDFFKWKYFLREINGMCLQELIKK